MYEKKIFFLLAAVIFATVNIFLSSVLFLDRDWKNAFIIEQNKASLNTQASSLKNILEKSPSEKYQEILAAWTGKPVSGLSAALYRQDGRIIYEDKTSFLFTPEKIKEKIKKVLERKNAAAPDEGSDILSVAHIVDSSEGALVLLCTMHVKLIPGKPDYILASSIISLFVSIVITLSVLLAFVKLFREPLLEMENISGKLAESPGLDETYIPEKSFFKRTARNINKLLEGIRKKEENAQCGKNELDAVFYSMPEGIIALDLKLNILQLNEAAMRLLHISRNAEGRPLQEAIRDTAIHAFAEGLLATKTALEEDFCVYAGSAGDMTVKIRGNVLMATNGSPSGLLLVISDISQIMKLENMRSEFVANVSHEIKTPITAIKGSIETLLDGAAENPAESKRFMEIIERHTDRLLRLLDDLLCLSRAESSKEMEFHLTSMPGVIKNAVELCHPKAEGKNISLNSECPDNISAEISLPGFEQALVNLLDNAIKYTMEGGKVAICASSDDQSMKISVTDNGCGISKEHLPRLFERFYRVDKARSRKMGGTGLGLAIVKHIIHAHGGSVEVESEPGKGSTFTMTLPLKHTNPQLKN